MKTIHFKDEGGGLYTTKFLPDGTIPNPNEMYEYGILQTKGFTKKEAIVFAKAKGMKYTFG